MINFIKNLITDRQKQLRKQDELDKIIESARHKCPQTLIDFFLFERQLNRIQCSKVDNSNIWEYPDIISKNMIILEKRNNELLQLLKKYDICFVSEKFNY